jgi:hypothetical protein
MCLSAHEGAWKVNTRPTVAHFPTELKNLLAET